MAKPGDIDSIRNALRPRMAGASTSSGGGGSTALPPHTHHASTIPADPYGTNAGDDVQEQLNEIADEKLSRDGSQPMLGNLDMDHHDIANVRDLEVEQDATVGRDATVTRDVEVGRDVHLTGGIGAAKVDGVRYLGLTGDEGDSEGRVDGVNALVFAEVTPVVAELGRASLDTTEDTLVFYVTSGSELVQIALGSSVMLGYNYFAPI